jgi:hypothetical protein
VTVGLGQWGVVPLVKSSNLSDLWGTCETEAKEEADMEAEPGATDIQTVELVEKTGSSSKPGGREGFAEILFQKC